VLGMLVALTVVAGVPVSAAAPADETELDLTRGIVVVDGLEVPVHGTFAYPYFGLGDNAVVRGVVHGAYRIDGGTALYYSLTEETEGIGFGETDAFPSDIQEPWIYDYGTASAVALLDVAGLQGYRPLITDGRALTSATKDLEAAPGELAVAFAVFPALPEGVEVVDVRIGRDVVEGIPVGDGALTPIAEEPAVLLGQGWPEIPSSDRIAAAAPGASTFRLSQRTADVDQVAQTEETVEQVAVTLDANVLFDKASAALSAGAQTTLAAVAADIAARGTGSVVVTGHTDSDGSDTDNQVLSEQRAASVLAALQPEVGAGITFEAVGKGESEPVAPNSSAEGQQQNRRVTVVYSVQGAKR
jgi:OmpA-OmpF porin, OOP family